MKATLNQMACGSADKGMAGNKLHKGCTKQGQICQNSEDKGALLIRQCDK